MELITKHGRRKSFPIEFVEVTEDNIDQVATWSGGVVGGEGKHRFIKLLDKAAINSQQTKAFINDVVVFSKETRTYKKFTRKAFNKAFEEVHSQVVHKDAGDGKFVSEDTAAANPGTTIQQSVDIPVDVREEVIATAQDKGIDPKLLGLNPDLPRDADPS